MKPQTTKKLFAFIVIMMFSFSFLNAQCPVGTIIMHPVHSCKTSCIPVSLVNNYLSNGWVIGFCVRHGWMTPAGKIKWILPVNTNNTGPSIHDAMKNNNALTTTYRISEFIQHESVSDRNHNCTCDSLLGKIKIER
jgi:hypothetical protein